MAVRRCAVLLALVVTGAHAQPASQPADPRRVAIAISGGVSLGSWEAGLNWGLVRYMRARGDHRLVSVSGASAGNVNSVLTAMSWCEAAGPDGQLPGRPTDNVFYKTWVHVGLESLLPTGDAHDAHDVECLPIDGVDRNVSVRAALAGLDHPDDYLREVSSVLRPDELVCRGVELASLLREPRYRDCEVPLAFTVTRARPGTLSLSMGIDVETQRYSVLLSASAKAGGPLEIRPYAPPDYPREDWETSPAVGLSLHPVTLADGRVPELAFLDYMRASAAFPIAFPPVLIEHCAERCGYEQTGDGASRFGGRCGAGKRVCREPFVDGGVFDNVPLGLAVTQAERLGAMRWQMRGDGTYLPQRGAPPTYLYLDPTQVRGRPEMPRAEPESFGCRASPDAACVGLGHLTAFGLNFVETARQYELQWVGRTLDFGGGGRSLVVSSRHPRIAGRYWGSYGAFIDAPLRRYDYCAGLYDAMVLAARELCVERDDRDKCVVDELPGIAADLGLYDPLEAVTLDVVQRLASHEQKLPVSWKDGRTVAPSACARQAGATCCPPCTDAEDAGCAAKRQMCIVHQALEGPGGGDLEALRERLETLGYEAEGREAQAMMGDLAHWQAALAGKVTRRLAAVERADRNPGGERVFEGLEFWLRTHFDVRGPWSWDLDPSTVPDDDDEPGGMFAHWLLPYSVSGSLRSTGILVDLWEPTWRLGTSAASMAFVFSPWLRQGAGENHGSFALVTGLDRVAWPLLGQLRLGPAAFWRYEDERAPGNNTCLLNDRFCFGLRAQLGLLWNKLRLTGGLTRFGVGCDASHLFDEPDAGCADVFLTLGVADVNGMLYWLARIF